MKYSAAFNESYNFYLKNIGVFDFCGTLNHKHEAIPNGSLSAKECFYKIDSEGINLHCSEPELLSKLLLCKASVNFQIKQWAEGRADGTLPLVEFSKNMCLIDVEDEAMIKIIQDCKVLEWVNGEPVYYSDIQSQYDLPQWVINAVENQKSKYYPETTGTIFNLKHGTTQENRTRNSD